MPAPLLALLSSGILAFCPGGAICQKQVDYVQVVKQATPEIEMTTSADSIPYGQSVSFTARLLGRGGAPTGVVTFLDDTTQLAATTLNTAGEVSFSTSALAIGTHTMTASYGGDANYTPASSPAVRVTVTIRNPGFTISGTPVVVAPGAITGNTSTITVIPSGGFTGSVALSAAITGSMANAESLPKLSFRSTSPVSITSILPGTATLTITTTAATSSTQTDRKRHSVPWYVAGGGTLACIFLLGQPARRPNWRRILGLLALFVPLAGGVACGGVLYATSGGTGGKDLLGTTPGIYIVTITGISGANTATGTVNLTVK
jgi:hypothetical protein